MSEYVFTMPSSRFFKLRKPQKLSISTPDPIPEQEPIETISSPLTDTSGLPTSPGAPVAAPAPAVFPPARLPSRKSSLRSYHSAFSAESTDPMSPPLPPPLAHIPGANLPNLALQPATPLSPTSHPPLLEPELGARSERPPLQSRFSADSSVLPSPIDFSQPPTPELDRSRSSFESSVSSPALSFRSNGPVSEASSASVVVGPPPRPLLSPNRSRTVVRSRNGSDSSVQRSQLLTPPLPEGAMPPAMSRTSSASSLRSNASTQSKFVIRDPALPLTESPLSLLALGIIMAESEVSAKYRRRSSTPAEELKLLATARQEADRMYRAVKAGPKLLMIGPD